MNNIHPTTESNLMLLPWQLGESQVESTEAFVMRFQKQLKKVTMKTKKSVGNKTTTKGRQKKAA
jgi:hypothetical protein